MEKHIKHVKQEQIFSMSLNVIAMVFCTSIGIHVISTGGVLAGTICVILGLANAICFGYNYSNYTKE